MNVLQIISGRGVNGALVYCKILSEELARRGHTVTILCRPTSWMKSNVDSSKVRFIESDLAKFPPGELKRIAKFVREQKIDLIHSHMTRGQNFAVALKLMTGVPVVATAHNRLFQFHWNFNNFVIANSKSTFEFHSRVNRIPASRMETIYCCSDLERMKSVSEFETAEVRKKLRLKPDDFLVGVIGEVAARKGHLHFAKALPEIVKQIPNVKAVFVGRFGRKQKHVQQTRQFLLHNGLAGRVKWVGRQSNIAAYMAACEMTVVPSLEEPLGLVAIESLVAGTPVVASDTGGLKEIVIHNETGLLVPPADEKAIADAVVTLARDAPMRRRLAIAGQQFVADTFSPANLIAQVEEVYERVTAAKKAA